MDSQAFVLFIQDIYKKKSAEQLFGGLTWYQRDSN